MAPPEQWLDEYGSEVRASNCPTPKQHSALNPRYSQPRRDFPLSSLFTVNTFGAVLCEPIYADRNIKKSQATLDRESQIRTCTALLQRATVQDPFTDFMTGKISERHAKQDRRLFGLMYLCIAALMVLAVAKLFI
jgi:hypothetical protein